MKRPNTTACLKLTVARATTGRNCERIGHIAQRAGCLGVVVPTAINLRGRALELERAGWGRK
jgi:hypothetical protein